MEVEKINTRDSPGSSPYCILSVEFVERPATAGENNISRKSDSLFAQHLLRRRVGYYSYLTPIVAVLSIAIVCTVVQHIRKVWPAQTSLKRLLQPLTSKTLMVTGREGTDSYLVIFGSRMKRLALVKWDRGVATSQTLTFLP